MIIIYLVLGIARYYSAGYFIYYCFPSLIDLGQ